MMLETAQYQLPESSIVLSFVKTELPIAISCSGTKHEPKERDLVQIHFKLVMSKISNIYVLCSQVHSTMFPKVLANFIRRNLFLKGNQRSSIFLSSVQFGVGYVLPCLTAAQSTKPPKASHCFWLQSLITESSLVACPAPPQLCENCFPHRWSSSKPLGDKYEIPVCRSHPEVPLAALHTSHVSSRVLCLHIPDALGQLAGT